MKTLRHSWLHSPTETSFIAACFVACFGGVVSAYACAYVLGL